MQRMAGREECPRLPPESYCCCCCCSTGHLCYTSLPSSTPPTPHLAFFASPVLPQWDQREVEIKGEQHPALSSDRCAPWYSQTTTQTPQPVLDSDSMFVSTSSEVYIRAEFTRGQTTRSIIDAYNSSVTIPKRLCFPFYTSSCTPTRSASL